MVIKFLQHIIHFKQFIIIKKTHLFENIGNQDITAHVDFDELFC